jgi:hypothetical protein
MEISIEDFNKGKKLIEDGGNTSDKLNDWLNGFNFPNDPSDYQYYGKFVHSFRWTDGQELEDQDVFNAIFDWSEQKWEKFHEDGKLTKEEEIKIKEYVINDYCDNSDAPVIVCAYLKNGDNELVVFAESFDGGMSEPERFVMGVFNDEGEAFETIFKDGEMC